MGRVINMDHTQTHTYMLVYAHRVHKHQTHTSLISFLFFFCGFINVTEGRITAPNVTQQKIKRIISKKNMKTLQSVMTVFVKMMLLAFNSGLTVFMSFSTYSLIKI